MKIIYLLIASISLVTSTYAADKKSRTPPISIPKSNRMLGTPINSSSPKEVSYHSTEVISDSDDEDETPKAPPGTPSAEDDDTKKRTFSLHDLSPLTSPRKEKDKIKAQKPSCCAYIFCCFWCCCCKKYETIS